MRYPGSAAHLPDGAVLQAQRAEELRSAGKGFALSIYLAYLFVLFSRFVDFILVGYHIPGMLFLASVPAALLCGAGSRLTLRGPMKWMAAFVVWFGLAVPFSVWRGGSLQQFRFLMVGMLSLIPILGLPSNYRDIRRIFLVLGVAVSVFAVFSLATGQFDGGRISVEGQGTFANTNDLAQILLLGLPFLLFSIYELRRQAIFSGTCLLLMIPVLVALVRTGSRSVVVAAFLMFVALFFRVSLTNKLKLLVVSGVLMVASVIALPHVTVLRFMTFFQVAKIAGVSVSDYEAQLSALESTLGRQELLRASVEYTIKHPIFGVGPGMFAVARGGEGEKLNLGSGMWKVTHNAYTQVSSECGVPALVFFVLMLGSAYMALRRAENHHKGLNFPVSNSLRSAAFALKVALLGYATLGMFLSIAYQQQIYVLVALALTLERVSQAELEGLQRSQNMQAAALPSGPQKFSYSMLPR